MGQKSFIAFLPLVLLNMSVSRICATTSTHQMANLLTKKTADINESPKQKLFDILS